MIQTTFLAHSGFLIQTDSCYFLIDWWKGDLPVLENKPLYVLASHRHKDHYDPHIFDLDATFILSDDIPLPEGQTAHVIGPNQTLTLDHVVIETLPSTDAGVAFILTVDGKTIYHAGDLHWWHWEGEPDPWNPDMEKNFKAYIAPLANRHLDLAFVPLDHRLQAAEDWGFVYVLNLAQVDAVVPMHQWNITEPTQRFCANYPQWAGLIHPLEQSGQTLTL